MHMKKNYNTDLLDGLSFFGRKNSEEGYNYEHGDNLINEGFAIDNSSATRQNETTKFKDKDEFREVQLYLNCKGNLINGCDWSYNSQEKKENILCHVNNFANFYNSIPEEN